jgi:hypothetical protein
MCFCTHKTQNSITSMKSPNSKLRQQIDHRQKAFARKVRSLHILLNSFAFNQFAP